jgi:PPP family 3-phenylpropionic acid transporter
VGLSLQQIGIIMSIIPFAAIAGQYVLGYLSDRLNFLRGILTISFLTAVILLSLYRLSTSFLFLMVITVLFTFFTSAHTSLSDAFTLQYSGEHSLHYNRIRMGGSAGYAVMSLVGGLLTVSEVNGMFAICIIVYLLSGLFCFFLLPWSRTSLPRIKSKKQTSFRTILQDKTIRLLLVITIISYIPIAIHGSFFSIYLVVMAKNAGGNSSIAGVAVFLALICQSVFLLFADRIYKRLGLRKMILGSFGVMSIRWLGTAVAPSYIWLVGVNCLDGFSTIVILFCTVTYLSNHVSTEWSVSGQAMFGICAYGVARVLGNLIGSFLIGFMSIRNVFFICFLLTGITTVCLVIGSLNTILHRRKISF